MGKSKENPLFYCRDMKFYVIQGVAAPNGEYSVLL